MYHSQKAAVLEERFMAHEEVRVVDDKKSITEREKSPDAAMRRRSVGNTTFLARPPSIFSSSSLNECQQQRNLRCEPKQELGLLYPGDRLLLRPAWFGFVQ